MFEFLQSIQPIVIEKEVKKTGKVKQEVNPTGLCLRIFKDGRVFPSKELVEQFGLEYNNKGSEEVSYGFDVWDSNSWSQYPSGEGIPNFVFIAKVDKNEAKVDLFGSVDFNEDGSPKKSVLEQGSKRPELIEKIREVYNLGVFTPDQATEDTSESTQVDPLFGSNNYVDMEIKVDIQVFPQLEKLYLPTEIKKGDKKGQMTYKERTNQGIYPLIVKIENNETE